MRFPYIAKFLLQNKRPFLRKKPKTLIKMKND